MYRLPLEIQDKIWNLYYKDIYKENVIHELKKYRYIFNSLHQKIFSIKNIIFSTQYLQINKRSIVILNDEIKELLTNKVIYLIYKSNNILSYLIQISKFSNAYNSLPTDCRLVGAYLYKCSNFNQKILKRLAVICSQENILFCKFYNNMSKSIKP